MSPRRQILIEGPLLLVDTGKPSDMHVILFDDLLLITRKKKALSKKVRLNIASHRSIVFRSFATTAMQSVDPVALEEYSDPLLLAVLPDWSNIQAGILKKS